MAVHSSTEGRGGGSSGISSLSSFILSTLTSRKGYSVVYLPLVYLGGLLIPAESYES